MSRVLAVLWIVVGSGCDCGYLSTPPALEDAGVEPDDTPRDAAAPDCHDRDGDGVGVGPECTPEDCDDTDPLTTTSCGMDCEAYPTRKGCRCEGPPLACYLGPPETSGRGVCEGGLKSCIDGVYGACEDQVLPSPEECNQLDDDCDGTADEGVLNACGDCSEACERECVGVGCRSAFAPRDEALTTDEPGALVLAEAPEPRHHLIWIANSADGTVSKIDTQLRQELARYRTGGSDDPDPSRTTVNLDGDVVVANREEGSATKIRASDCEDRDGDGIRLTSSGANDVLEWGADECVVWNVGGIPAARGSAFELRTELDGATRELVWVASYPYAPGPLYEIDSHDGTKTGRQVDDMPGYGAAMGPDGRLWLVAVYGCISSIDTRTLERTDYSCMGEQGYGITVDVRGRVWIGGSVARFDPALGTWESPADDVTGGGIAVDAAGNAWVGEAGEAYRIDGVTLEATPIPDAGGHGWAVDFDGYAWAIELGDSATIVDPFTLDVTRITPPFVEAYTYSDMTGTQLGNVVPTRGTWSRVFAGCEGPTSWSELSWIADVAEDGHTITFRVRSADTLLDLGQTEWTVAAVIPGDSSPVPLDDVLERAGLPSGELLEVEIVMFASPGAARPRLESFAIEHDCGG